MTDKQNPDAAASSAEHTGGVTAGAQDDGTPNVFSKANAVLVEPGGAIFQSIGEAIASVKDARRKRQYLLHIGPGIYHEKVVMKPFISLRGAGPGETILTAPAEKEQQDAGTVRAASNCSLTGLTVVSHGGTWGYNATALNCLGVRQFMVANAELKVDDEGNAGINLIAVGVDSLASFAGSPSEVYITHCIITATAQSKDSSPTCLIIGGAMAGTTVDVHVSKIIARGGRRATAALANNNGKLNIYNTHAVGEERSVVSGDMSAAITATNSHLEGTTSNVAVTDNPTPVYGNWGALQAGGE